jgi:hypothetical protein
MVKINVLQTDLLKPILPGGGYRRWNDDGGGAGIQSD